MRRLTKPESDFGFVQFFFIHPVVLKHQQIFDGPTQKIF